MRDSEKIELLRTELQRASIIRGEAIREMKTAIDALIEANLQVQTGEQAKLDAVQSYERAKAKIEAAETLEERTQTALVNLQSILLHTDEIAQTQEPQEEPPQEEPPQEEPPQEEPPQEEPPQEP